MQSQLTTIPVQPFRIVHQPMTQLDLCRALTGKNRVVKPGPVGLYLSQQAFVAWRECRDFLWVRVALASEIDDPRLRPVNPAGMTIIFRQPAVGCSVHLCRPPDWPPVHLSVVVTSQASHHV